MEGGIIITWVILALVISSLGNYRKIVGARCRLLEK